MTMNGTTAGGRQERRRTRRATAAAFALLAASVVTATATQGDGGGGGFWVRHTGTMRGVMRDRDFSARIDLADLKTTPNLYAIGPAEGLNGEITVFDGTPVIAVAEGRPPSVRVKRTYPKAAFLVYGRVPRWQAAEEIPAAVKTADDLEAFVERAARAKGIDTAKPFPFRVRGVAEAISYHVVSGGEHVPFEARRARVEVLGFYSARHHGVFTHHGTNVHLHFRTGDGRTSGHVDALTLGPRPALFLPAVP